MLRIIVDSGSSIKQAEKSEYNVDILPLRVIFEDKDYADEIEISNEEFYHKLIDEKLFPKTALPELESVQKLVEGYTKAGDEVLLITISSKISGTFNTISNMFKENEKVHVFDSMGAVGAIRYLVMEANKYRDKDIDFVLGKLEELRSKIHIMAIPETLEYLYRGGRLNRFEKILGDTLHIKPVIGFVNGEVKVIAKKLGLRGSMQYISKQLSELDCDTSYPIIASYSYNQSNLDALVNMCDEKYKQVMTIYDNLDPAIACHWGPNAFGFIFVSTH